MRLYIAGPMSGIPSFNVPAFDRMAATLRARGHEVVSPAELDGPETRAVIMASKKGDHADLPPGETWGFYLARDIRLIADDGIQGIVVLPGWKNSPGARLEVFFASAIIHLPILSFNTEIELVRVSPSVLSIALTAPLFEEPLFNMLWKKRVGMPPVERTH